MAGQSQQRAERGGEVREATGRSVGGLGFTLMQWGAIRTGKWQNLA